MTRCLSLALALGAGLLGISGVTCAQNTAEPSFTLKPVGPNVWAAISNPTSTTAAGANTGFVIGDDSVAVIDATMSGMPTAISERSLLEGSSRRFAD